MNCLRTVIINGGIYITYNLIVHASSVTVTVAAAVTTTSVAILAFCLAYICLLLVLFSPSMASHTMRCLVVTATVSVATDCHGFEPQSKDSGRWLGRGQIVGRGPYA
ncbi:hypothetical protein EV1_014738 [Malus domestica]